MLFEKSRKEPDVAVDIAPAHHSVSDSGDYSYGAHDISKAEAQGGQAVISDGVFGNMDDHSGPNYRAVRCLMAAVFVHGLTRSRLENGAR